MMKRLAAFLSSIFMVLALTSCSLPDISTAEKIVSPSNSQIPIRGEWRIEGFKTGNSKNLSDDEAKQWVGRTAIFDEDIAAVGDDSCPSPAYKVKNVNSGDYLLYQYKINPDYLEITAPKVQVVSVSSGGQFFYEFIKTDDSRIIANIEGTFFYLDKVSESISQDNKNKYAEKALTEVRSNISEGSAALQSGLLLGLRSAEKTGSKGAETLWEYRTLYISSTDKALGNIFTMPDLFVPRKSGFWKLGVNREISQGVVRENLYAYPVDKEIYKSEPQNNTADEKNSVFKTILYAGNDYVSTEFGNKSPDTPIKSVLKVFPLDSIENAKAVKISDIAGEGGKFALNDGAAKYISSDASSSRNLFNSLSEENFAVSRRNGHWIMKGRLSPLDNSSFVDFNIKAIPPSKLVSYDELCISWNSIKGRVPEAVDAFTSPNKDIAVIITGNSILAYSIDNNTLSEKPLKKLQLKDKESVVMAEWAQGRYADKWEKDFSKNGAYEISE